MEDENDLENIFEEYENEDADDPTNEPQIEENAATNETNEAQTREVVPVPKRIIRNPRLKFNADRLCGEKGIPVVTKHFKNVKFKGKGHEKEDLDKLLSTLELWSHRLFPSMKFEACLKQIEKLGYKRPVKTCLVKIRRDMPILSGDFVQDEDDEVEQEGMQKELESEAPPEDAFDRIFGSSLQNGRPSNLASTPQTASTSGVALGTSFGGSLTEEQRKRMEYNKMLAVERRKARMAAMQSAAEEDSRRVSPSVLDSGFVESNTSSTTVEPLVTRDLDAQFDSLFGEPNQTKLVHSDSRKKGYKSMGGDSKDNQSCSEDYENENKTTQGVFEKNLLEPICDDFQTDQSESVHGDSETNQQKLDHDDFGKNAHKSTKADSERSLKESNHDSESNSSELIPDMSKLNDCKSMHLTGETEEELGLDELMDLVDEDDAE